MGARSNTARPGIRVAAQSAHRAVRLARSNRAILVEPGKSILDALLEAGVAASFSCMEGVYGTCETRILEGIPDHRDQFLSKEEQATNKTMMICCSGVKTKTLTLDL